MKYAGYTIWILLALMAGCMPELPVTSIITVDMESVTQPVNEELYGLSLKELDHTDDGGFYAEYIQNRSFDRGDSLPGWRALSPNTYLKRNMIRPMSESNPYSLMVSVFTSDPGRRGGVVAEGFGGIPVRKGEKYHLSFFLRTATSVTSVVPIQIALEDSLSSKRLCAVYEATPSYMWTRHTHTFIATEDAPNAVLAFSINASSYFWIDMVSLMPDNTWNNRPNGFRPDLMEMIAALSPSFILYKGKNTDDGFQTFLQLCSDLHAEAVFTFDSSRVALQQLYAGEALLVSGHSFASTSYAQGAPAIWIDGFAAVDGKSKGTLRATIAEACFLIMAEKNPRIINRIAFAPVAGMLDSKSAYPPLVSFSNRESVASPSYYLLQMFASHRGNVVLKTEVATYSRPQVTLGQPEWEAPDNSFELKDARIETAAGADSLYNYEFSVMARRTKEKGKALLYVRDHICMTIGNGRSELYQLSGQTPDTLSSPRPFTFEEGRFYQVRMVCRYDTLRCYIDNTLIHDVVMPSLPSIVSIATLDKNTRTLLLKVVNTTLHDELTEINIRGAGISNQATLLQLKGLPEWRNTPELPRQVSPSEQTVSFPIGRTITYKFPPSSVTILKLSLN
jgi:hypothetical protein